MCIVHMQISTSAIYQYTPLSISLCYCFLFIRFCFFIFSLSHQTPLWRPRSLFLFYCFSCMCSRLYPLSLFCGRRILQLQFTFELERRIVVAIALFFFFSSSHFINRRKLFSSVAIPAPPPLFSVCVIQLRANESVSALFFLSLYGFIL